MGRYGTTAQRGLGWEHVKDKNRLLAIMQDGEPCWRCGQPMYKWQALDRDHIVDRAIGGVDGPAVLAHRSCNCRAGARNGNQRQPRSIAVAKAPPATCKTCGKTYRRAARACEICGTHYHPTYGAPGEQRTCSRSCGVELKRRNGTLSVSRVQPRRRTCDCPTGSSHVCFVGITYRNCANCGQVFVSRSGALTCSSACQAQRQAARMAEYQEQNEAQIRETWRQRNDELGEARGWPRGKGSYNVGREPWNKRNRMTPLPEIPVDRRRGALPPNCPGCGDYIPPSGRVRLLDGQWMCFRCVPQSASREW